MGDALDDGEFEAYEPEPEGELDLGDDDNETPAAGLGKRKADDEGDEEGGDGGGGGKKKKKKRGKKKRKGAAAGDGDGTAVAEADDAADGDEDEQGEEGKKKKKQRKRKKKGAVVDGAADGIGTAEGQAAYLWDRYCELLDISPLDRDVQRLPAGCILLPSKAAPATPPANSNKNNKNSKGGKGAKVPETCVTDFLKRALPGLQKLASDKANRVVGRPLVVIVSPAAVRANDLAKELRVRLPNQRTAKLFGKHIKAQEQAEVLKKEFNALAVGTPARLGKLLEMGAFSLSNCRLLVLDASFRDAKEFTLLTLPGVAKDVALLLKEHVLPAMEGQKGGAEGLRIAMF